jgi:transposase
MGMSGIPEATPIRLTEEERAELLSLAPSTKTEYRMRQRARIVLLAAEGMASRAIGREVGCTTGTASKWRVRYARDRWPGWTRPATAAPKPKYTVETDKHILAVPDRPVPAGHGRWSGPLIAAELGDVDVQYVWRFLRAQKIDLAARKSWCESNDPAFAAKAAEIVALYLDPPDGALVLAVDEKPSIQALERRRAISGCQWARAHGPIPRLQATWHHHPVRSAQRCQRRGPRQALQPSPAHRVPRLHEPDQPSIPSGKSMSFSTISTPQAEERPLAQPSSQRALPLHANTASWLNQIEIWSTRNGLKHVSRISDSGY